jgi:hypothetical protein
MAAVVPSVFDGLVGVVAGGLILAFVLVAKRAFRRKASK